MANERPIVNMNIAEEFLRLLDPTMAFTFQTFDDVQSLSPEGKKIGRKNTSLIQVHLNRAFDDSFKQELVELNNRGAGVFVSVNSCDGHGRKEENIVSARAFFADKDDGPFGEFPLEPSILVQTARGQHAYWLLDQEIVDLKKWKAIQRKLIMLLGADRAVSNPASVMRVPGFLHQKNPDAPFLVSILNRSGRKYSVEDIENLFPIENKKPPVKTVRTENEKKVAKFRLWANSLSAEEGANNPDGGRNSTLVRLVREGLGQGHAEDFVWSIVETYCERSSFELAEARQLFDRHISQHQNEAFKPFLKDGDSLFVLKDDGLYFNDGDTDSLSWISSRIEVVALTRNSNKEEWGRLLKIKDRDGHEKMWAMPMKLLATEGAELRAHLLSLGLTISTSRKARERLTMYIQTAEPNEKALCVSRIGWHGEAYLLPPDEIFAPGDIPERIVLQMPLDSYRSFQTKGTLEEWKENIGELCRGNSRLLFAISTAFAAPLLNLTGDESAGIHLRSGSSLGKTTALKIAGSVCGGGGVNGYVNRWRATINGLEAQAEAHCDCLLILDELAQVDPSEAGSAAYMLANGSGKARANELGSARRVREWRLLFLSAGEIGLSEHMGEVGKRVRAGQEARMADLPADAGAGYGLFENLHGFSDPSAFANHLIELTTKFYGTPLRGFMTEVTRQIEAIKNDIAQDRNRFLNEVVPAGASGQVKRVAGRFALIASAGEIATAFGIVPWATDEAFNAAKKCFQSWLNERGGSKDAEAIRAVSQVRAFLEAHGESRFTDLDAPTESRRLHNRAGYLRQSDDGGSEWLILKEVFKRQVCQGFDPKHVAKVLKQMGFLVADTTGSSTYPVRLPSLGQVRVYRIKSSILGRTISNQNEDVPVEPNEPAFQGFENTEGIQDSEDTVH